MINFEELPNKNPFEFTLISKGTYFGTIEKATMAKGQDESKPEYISIVWNIKDAQGTSQGKLFDMITEPAHEITKYKLQRIIKALELPITGQFMLKDLCKILPNKQCIIDITIDEKSAKPKNVTDVFQGQIYYEMSKANEMFPDMLKPSTPTKPKKVEAADADPDKTTEGENVLADAQQPTEDSKDYQY